MGLQLRQGLLSRHSKRIAAVFAMLAFVAQPMYGMVASYSASAAPSDEDIPTNLSYTTGQACGGHTAIAAQPTWEAVAGAVSYDYQALLDGSVVSSANYATPPGPETLFTTATDGAWGFQVRSVDADDLKSDWSPVCTLTLDTVAPTGTLTYTPSGPASTNGNVLVTLETNEPIQQSSLPGIWTKHSDTEYQKSYAANASEEVMLEDLAGNTSTVTVVIDWIDTTAPVIAITDAIPNIDGTWTISGTASEAATVSVSINGGPPISISGVSTTWAFTTGILGVGTHTITTSGTDAAGNTSAPRPFFLTVAAPETGNGDIVDNSEEAPDTDDEPSVPDTSPIIAQLFDPSATEVLGQAEAETTDTPAPLDHSDTDVLSATTEPATKEPADTIGFMGLAWYWWLAILAALIGLWQLVAVLRRRGNGA